MAQPDPPVAGSSPSHFSIGQCVALACLLEVTAPKPGNVHRGADFEDASYSQFVAAGIALTPVFDRAADVPLGQTVLAAVEAAARSRPPTPIWARSCCWLLWRRCLAREPLPVWTKCSADSRPPIPATSTRPSGWPARADSARWPKPMWPRLRRTTCWRRCSRRPTAIAWPGNTSPILPTCSTWSSPG